MGGSSQDSKNKYWFEDSIPIKNRFYGVFEGGGAKGVAYNGALQAMEKNECWFCSVAGASAGAITAALIASGLSPKQIEKETDHILGNIARRRWLGLLRLRNKTGFFPSDVLLKHLKDVIKTQVKLITGAKRAEDEDVTFRELYEATHIELNVIAADLSLRRQIIFNKKLTPECGVADAVVASCSIPYAFPSMLLQVFEGKKKVEGEEIKIFSNHTIVDGGVWSNFPMFIYEDKAFRKFYELDPEEIDSRRVLGFLLKEDDDETSPKGKDVRFVENNQKRKKDNQKRKVEIKEWLPKKKTNGDKPPSCLATIFAVLLIPIFLIGIFLEAVFKERERGRWPPPKSLLVKNLIEGINGFLGGIYFPPVGLIVCVIIALGAWPGAWKLINILGLDQLIVSIKASTGILSIFWYIITYLVVYCVVIMVIFVTVLGVFTNFFLLRASRRVFYGLITTLAAAPGAPEWVVKKENIIELPIDATVKTLSFEKVKEGETMRTTLIDNARKVTIEKLEGLFPKKDKVIKNHKAPGKWVKKIGGIQKIEKKGSYCDNRTKTK